MKTLILFRYIYKMLNIRWYLRNSNVNKSRFKLSMGNLLTPELKNYFKTNSLKCSILWRFPVAHIPWFIATAPLTEKTTDSKIPNEDLIFIKESWISEMRDIIPEWAAYGNMPKKRNLDFYFQETLNDFMDATNIDSDIRLDYLGLSLQIEKRVTIKNS